MGQSNVPLLQESTVFSVLLDGWNQLGIDAFIQSVFVSAGLEAFIPKTWSVLAAMCAIIVLIKLSLDYFLKT
ncbi:hypothetical protein K4G93_24705, partial [Mycobacterium tuberculosis]|nr:hypothetical protein [Mycobacterium tuberculosis]